MHIYLLRYKPQIGATLANRTMGVSLPLAMAKCLMGNDNKVAGARNANIHYVYAVCNNEVKRLPHKMLPLQQWQLQLLLLPGKYDKISLN